MFISKNLVAKLWSDVLMNINEDASNGPQDRPVAPSPSVRSRDQHPRIATIARVRSESGSSRRRHWRDPTSPNPRARLVRRRLRRSRRCGGRRITSAGRHLKGSPTRARTHPRRSMLGSRARPDRHQRFLLPFDRACRDRFPDRPLRSAFNRFPPRLPDLPFIHRVLSARCRSARPAHPSPSDRPPPPLGSVE